MRQVIFVSSIVTAFIAAATPASTALAQERCTTFENLIGPTGAREAMRDMRDAGEATPNGVKSDIDWSRRGRVALGNNPGRFNHIIPWGHIYAAPGNKSVSEQVQIRRLRLYVLGKRDGIWRRLVETNLVSGGLYLPNYDDGRSRATRERFNGRQTTAVTQADRSFHFWSTGGRIPIRSDDIGAVFVAFDVRVAPGQGSRSKFIAGAGADYWAAKDAQWDHYKTNGDAGIGRFKRLSTKWRTIYMTTATPQQFSRCTQRD